MNEDINKYPIFELYKGRMREIKRIKSTLDYDHYRENLHHFVPRKTIKKYPQLEVIQRLILMDSKTHMDLHGGMSDERFYELYKVERSELLYNVKRHGRGGAC